MTRSMLLQWQNLMEGLWENQQVVIQRHCQPSNLEPLEDTTSPWGFNSPFNLGCYTERTLLSSAVMKTCSLKCLVNSSSINHPSHSLSASFSYEPSQGKNMRKETTFLLEIWHVENQYGKLYLINIFSHMVKLNRFRFILTTILSNIASFNICVSIVSSQSLFPDHCDCLALWNL